MHVHRDQWRVDFIDRDFANAFIEKYHYAKGAGSVCIYAFGLFDTDGMIRGTAIWSTPQRPAAAFVSRLLDVDEDSVVHLTRLAVHDCVPTNGASFLLGRSLRVLRQDDKWDAALTYADDRLHHTGAIYRATNWHFAGYTKPRRLWTDRNGRLVASRDAQRNVRVATMLAAGYVQTDLSRKRRFVMGLNRRVNRRAMQVCAAYRDVEGVRYSVFTS